MVETVTEPQMPEPSTTPNDASAPGAPPFFNVTPSAFARFLRFAMAKGGGGEPPFPVVDIRFTGEADNRFLYSNHLDKAGTSIISLEMRVPQGGDNFEATTTDAEGLLKYLTGGIFQSDTPLRVWPETTDVPTLFLGDGFRTVRKPLSSPESVRRDTMDPSGVTRYGGVFDTTGRYLFSVRSSPKTRPAASATLAQWRAAGYTVIALPVEELNAILSIGDALLSKDYKFTLVNFRVHEGVLTVSVRDPKHEADDGYDSKPIAAVVAASIDGDLSKVPMPTDSFSLRFDVLSPFLTSLRQVDTKVVYVIHGPNESGVNFCAYEQDEKGTVTLRLSQMVSRYKDPAEPKAAPVAPTSRLD